MRFFVGYFGSALIAALFAMIWVAVQQNGQTLLGSIGLPSFVTTTIPELAIHHRRLLVFYTETARPAAAALDWIAGFGIFLILNLPGMLLYRAVDFAFGEEVVWQRAAPIGGAVIFAVIATLVVMACWTYGLPPFAGLKLNLVAVPIAAAVSGLLYGLGSLFPSD
ncbi:MAG: hypothetical protein ABTQ29_14090 [Siculibacillus sp.]